MNQSPVEAELQVIDSGKVGGGNASRSETRPTETGDSAGSLHNQLGKLELDRYRVVSGKTGVAETTFLAAHHA